MGNAAKKTDDGAPRYPGIRASMDGSAAVVEMETAGSEAAGAYPITPSTQMGEGWALAVAAGKTNVNGRKLIFFEPEGEHAAAAVTAGMNLMGLRSTNFSSGQGIAYMHESLYAAVGKRLTYVLNVACRAMTKQALNVHAGHDDYHAVDDTGFFQLFAKDVQGSADLNLVAHRVSELTLNPGICAQDGFLTSHVIETMVLPEPELVREYLGDPHDMIESPTPAQRMVFGQMRRRIPEMFNLDAPAMLGVVQNQDAYAQGVAAQRPFYFDHVADLTDRAFDEFAALTGRRYARASGYLLEDAEWVLCGQGSVVSNAECVADHLRKTRGLKVGVMDVTMFRPFPADLITRLLAGKKGVTVLERVDQPLAVDAPLLREIRAAMGKAVENGRSEGSHPGVTALRPEQVPDFFSACFGLGSRDLQPGDLIAAADNMLADGRRRRQYYLGIEFVRPGTRLPKLEIWQDQLRDAYPDIVNLALPTAGDLNLMPEGATSIRIHSVGGWGAITMGKNLAMTASELLGLHIKANPKYGSEKKGQPTTFYATLADEPIRLNCELKHVGVVLSPDPNVFRHSDPLAGLQEGGVFIIQSELSHEQLWASFPERAQRAIKDRNLRVCALDAFAIAMDEASNPELRYRMQGAAFMGAFFHAAPLMERRGLDEERLFEGITSQLHKKFGHLGDRVVEDNLRVIRRGFDEVREMDLSAVEVLATEAGVLPSIPADLTGCGPCGGVGDQGRFWEQVGYLYSTGEDGIADPFAAISALPAATSTIRDMTDVRFEVPEFDAQKCTGCSQCWVQCPDAAIPGLVNSVQDVIDAAITSQENGRSLDRMRQASKHLAKECQRLLRTTPFTGMGEILRTAYEKIAPKLAPDPERRKALDAEFTPVCAAVAEFPLAKTAPFFDAPEGREKGTGGLLSITINPQTCKGCNVCVEVCPDGALYPVRQDDEVIDKLRRNWKLWEKLPDTDDRYVAVSDVDEGIGVLSSLLLKKENYRSMMGGDGACMGCGEKTAVHLVLSAVHALLGPKIKDHVQHLQELVAGLEGKARELLAADADIADLDVADVSKIEVPLEGEKKDRLQRIQRFLAAVKDLHWRYVEGPGGHGRTIAGFANATGCSSVWGSTYPYNPYPFPWVNHLFQDAPSIAIGLFEGHMRKMSDGFAAIRRAELELAGTYHADEHEPFLTQFDWHQFTDEEFALCPPIFAVGGDGAMLDIGFQNLSRLMASGKPLRVIVLDTQVYSNTGGQACTSGFTGQVSDMAAFGPDQHGKTEVRKELSLISIAHRGVFTVQSSQAAPSHMLGSVLRALRAKRPSLMLLHCPCPPEHGIADDQANHAAKLALESRAFPVLCYDPDEGQTLADHLSLDGNPALDDLWPTYELKYTGEDGAEATLEIPLTIADWAATEARFKRHFRRIKDGADGGLVPFHEYLDLAASDRDGQTPFIHAIDQDRRLSRMSVAPEIVELAEERVGLWIQLKQMAGLELTETARRAVVRQMETEFKLRTAELQAGFERQMGELKASYAGAVARKIAEGLIRASANGQMSVKDLLSRASTATPVSQQALVFTGLPAPASSAGPAAATADAPAAATTAVAETEVEEDEDGDLALDPYIDTIRCTTCDECTNINRKMFAYNEKKQAYIKDATAGTFRQLVTAAEKCPAFIIHPGTPLDPDEPDLEKWMKRAEKFN